MQAENSRVVPLAGLESLLYCSHGRLDVFVLKGHGCLHHQDAAVPQSVVHAVLRPTTMCVAVKAHWPSNNRYTGVGHSGWICSGLSHITEIRNKAACFYDYCRTTSTSSLVLQSLLLVSTATATVLLLVSTVISKESTASIYCNCHCSTASVYYNFQRVYC